MFKTIIDFFAGWKVKLVILAFILASAFAWHRVQIHAAVNDAITELKQEQSKEIFKLKDRANEATIVLKNTTDKNLKEKDARIKSIDAKYTTSIASLSDRPDRPSTSSVPGDSSNAESSTGITGLQLSKPDSQFLSWIARDTSRLQEELKSCYVQYDSVKESLENFKKLNLPKP